MGILLQYTQEGLRSRVYVYYCPNNGESTGQENGTRNSMWGLLGVTWPLPVPKKDSLIRQFAVD